MDIFTWAVNCPRFAMDYIRFGTGEKTFVILPGISLTGVLGAADAIAAAYAPFAEEYTVYVFERRRNFPAGYSVWEMAEDTAAAMLRLGIETADLFGASQGAMIALCIAAKHPELVHSAVLGSTTAKPDRHGTEVLQSWITLAETGNVRQLNRSFFEHIYSDAFLTAYADALAEAETVGTPEDCKRFITLAQACIDFDLEDTAAQIRCPLLVIGAENDRVFSPDVARELAALLRCPLYLYDGYGHAVYDEAPDYKERLLRFYRNGQTD